jgi:hypothetical protein
MGGKVRVNLEIVGETSEAADAGGDGVRFNDGVWSCCRKMASCIGTVDFCVTDARLLGDSRNTTVSMGGVGTSTELGEECWRSSSPVSQSLDPADRQGDFEARFSTVSDASGDVGTTSSMMLGGVCLIVMELRCLRVNGGRGTRLL